MEKTCTRTSAGDSKPYKQRLIDKMGLFFLRKGGNEHEREKRSSQKACI